MQKLEQYNISRKSSQDEANNIQSLQTSLSMYLHDKLQMVLQLYRETDKVYLYQVEQIMQDMGDEWMNILLDNIHDYYLTCSENSQAEIDNNYHQSITDNAIQQLTTNTADKGILDDITFYEDALEDIGLTYLLRSVQNKQTTLQNLKNPLLNRIPTPFRTPLIVDEIFEYEVDQAVIDYMSKELFVASSSTMERITQEIYDIIKQSYAEEGNGISQVTQDILEKFNDLAEYEAERIARTETLKAQGHANYMRLLNDPNVEYKQWIATDDEHTRDSHSEQNEQITYVDGTFANGCQYNGDTNADIEEWIECRCETISYFPEPGMSPPAGAEYWFEDDMEIDIDVERYDYLVEVPEYIPSYW